MHYFNLIRMSWQAKQDFNILVEGKFGGLHFTEMVLFNCLSTGHK